MKSKKDLSFIYSNPFLLIASIIISISMWFYMAMSNILDRPNYVYDVPITIELSEEAIEQGVKIFDQNITTATVTVSGDALIIGRVTSSDVAVVADVSPDASELSSMTLTTETVSLYGEKLGNILANYDVDGVSSSEITVTYDIYAEEKFTIENNLKYTENEDSYISSVTMSDKTVIISGPKSELEQIESVSLDLEIKSVLSQSTTVTSTINVYDIDGNIVDLSDTYLEISAESVDVSFDIQAKQTVTLEVETINLPDGFGSSRIVIDPVSIDIAGEESVISEYETITLTDVIDFTTINLSNKDFVMAIPVPSDVYNINGVEFAKISINLSGYTETTINASQIEFLNVPNGKEITLVTDTVEVLVVAPSAIGTTLTDDDVYVTVDMSNYTSIDGEVEVPVTVYIEGSDSAWVSGTYTVMVTISDAVEE